MIFSMTAFAAASKNTPWGILSLEVRSVNHRFLEMSLKLPDELRQLDPAIRQAVKAELARGKLDISLKFSRLAAEENQNLSLNKSLAASLNALAENARELFPDSRTPSLTDWLQWPGLVEEPTIDMEQLGDAVLETVGKAIGDLKAMRQREGGQLESMIAERLDEVATLADEVTGLLPELRQLQKARLDDKVSTLASRVDPDRLEQELAIVLQKLDIDEEIDRLRAHLVEIRRTLELDKPVGRRLDFLMQELHREANTLGSKSVDARTTRISVDLKVLIEQMREQVQNIE